MDLAVAIDPPSVRTPAYFDLVMGPTGDVVLVNGPEAVGQAINQRLAAFLGDFFLALNEGLDYLSAFSTRQGLTPAFDAAMRATVVETPGVLQLYSWEPKLDAATRSLSVKFTAQVTGGVVNYATQIPSGGGKDNG